MPSVNQLLKPSEVQRFIPGKTARVLCVERCNRRDTPPFIRIGRRIYYDLESLQAWIEAHRVDPANRTPGNGAEREARQ